MTLFVGRSEQRSTECSQSRTSGISPGAKRARRWRSTPLSSASSRWRSLACSPRCPAASRAPSTRSRARSRLRGGADDPCRPSPNAPALAALQDAAERLVQRLTLGLEAAERARQAALALVGQPEVGDAVVVRRALPLDQSGLDAPRDEL